jgi:uncharacterized protein (DUF1800 family)
MELFTLGNGQFTEAEVVDMARAWTGHNLARDNEHYEWHPTDHDNGAKRLFGITKNWDGPEALTEIVRGVRQPTCARFLAAKIWSFFAYPNPSTALVDELATGFIASGMNVKALLRIIFLHPDFRLPTTRTALVRSPVDYLVATIRMTGLPIGITHPEWWVEPMGQRLYAPPNVSGWKQNAAWISTSAQWAKGSHAGYVRWKANDAGLLATTGTMTPAAATQAAFDLFGINEPSPVTRQKIEAFVAGEQAARRNWAIPPGLVALAMLSPDYQLA